MVDTDSSLRDTASQTADVGQPSPPYPLTRSGYELWLRRGERLGLGACRVAASLAAGFERAAKWRRHVASKGPIDTPPPQPG